MFIRNIDVTEAEGPVIITVGNAQITLRRVGVRRVKLEIDAPREVPILFGGQRPQPRSSGD